VLAVFEQAHTPTDPTWPRTNDYFTPPLTDGQMEQVQQCINDALRAQAYTPTDAQPRKVPHTGPGHASGDAGFCEGCLAERDQNKRGPECIPGEPFTLEDLAREHDNLAAHPTQMSQTIPAFHTLTAKALRWAAGFRRTAVQEPLSEPTDAQACERCGCVDGEHLDGCSALAAPTEVDADPDTAFELGRVLGGAPYVSSWLRERASVTRNETKETK
jgi:hypothetical protein